MKINIKINLYTNDLSKRVTDVALSIKHFYLSLNKIFRTIGKKFHEIKWRIFVKILNTSCKDNYISCHMIKLNINEYLLFK